MFGIASSLMMLITAVISIISFVSGEILSGFVAVSATIAWFILAIKSFPEEDPSQTVKSDLCSESNEKREVEFLGFSDDAIKTIAEIKQKLREQKTGS